jgi:hypothetical protein
MTDLFAAGLEKSAPGPLAFAASSAIAVLAAKYLKSRQSVAAVDTAAAAPAKSREKTIDFFDMAYLL